MEMVKVSRPFQDLAKTLPALVDGTQRFIRTQRSDDGGVELLYRQLGLGFVVVDVVIEDHPLLWRLTGLAGSQYDTHQRVMHFVADPVHQPQARVFCLHHHIEQDQGNFGIGLQHGGSFGTAVGVEQFERAGFVLNIGEGKPGGMMNVGLIIHDQHLPGVECLGGYDLFVIEFDDVVIQPNVVLVLGTAHIGYASGVQ